MINADPAHFFPGFLPPTLIVPTQKRIDQYLDPEFDYSAYLKNLRLQGPVQGGETQLENIITLCIEGEFREALNYLLQLPEEQFSEFQRVAYLRLAGGLFEDIGDLEQSQLYLRRALDLSQQLSARPAGSQESSADAHTTVPRGQIKTLRRFLRREISLSLERYDLLDRGAFARYEAARKIDAPVFLGYQEYARAVADALMIHEEFKASLREEGSSYARSGFPAELAWINLSLWMAYTCGDTRRARYTRTNFGRWAVLHGLRENSTGLLASGIQELIRSKVLESMEDLLARVGHLVHTQINVNDYFQHFRPVDVSGPAAAPMWRTLHMLVKTMVGYASVESVAALHATYSQGLARYLDGQPGMAADRTYAVSYFLEAYSELGPTAEDIERLMMWASEKKVGPDRIHNPWALVKAYRWDDSEALPLITRVLECLKALYPRGETEEYVQIFTVLNRHLPHIMRGALDVWISEHLDQDAQFDYWVNGSHEQVRNTILPMLRSFLEPRVRELRTTEDGSPLSFGGPIVASYISAVFANYQDVNDRGTDAIRTEIIRDYLQALTNPSIHARFKADDYAYLARAMRYTSDEVKAAIQPLLISQLPEREQSREVSRGFFGEIGRPVDAQLSLWCLRSRAGIPSRIEELPLLTAALMNRRVRTRQIAADTAATVLEEHQDGEAALRQALLALLYSRSFDENAWVRRAAMTGLLQHWGQADAPWGASVVDRLRALIQTDQPFVASSILWTLRARMAGARQQPSVREQAVALAEVGKVNSHRGVRVVATGVLGVLTEDSGGHQHLSD